MAVLMPINCPFVLTNAPPELPGFTAASVWINDCEYLPVGSRFLAFALIIPAVTVDVKLNGFPTAKTHSPIFALSESAKVTKGNSSSASIFNQILQFLLYKFYYCLM